MAVAQILEDRHEAVLPDPSPSVRSSTATVTLQRSFIGFTWVELCSAKTGAGPSGFRCLPYATCPTDRFHFACQPGTGEQHVSV